MELFRLFHSFESSIVLAKQKLLHAEIYDQYIGEFVHGSALCVHLFTRSKSSFTFTVCLVSIE